jgi:hypothetical protein
MRPKESVKIFEMKTNSNGGRPQNIKSHWSDMTQILDLRGIKQYVKRFQMKMKMEISKYEESKLLEICLK